jgi:hypothetical protein
MYYRFCGSVIQGTAHNLTHEAASAQCDAIDLQTVEGERVTRVYIADGLEIHEDCDPEDCDECHDLILAAHRLEFAELEKIPILIVKSPEPSCTARNCQNLVYLGPTRRTMPTTYRPEHELNVCLRLWVSFGAVFSLSNMLNDHMKAPVPGLCDDSSGFSFR